MLINFKEKKIGKNIQTIWKSDKYQIGKNIIYIYILRFNFIR